MLSRRPRGALRSAPTNRQETVERRIRVVINTPAGLQHEILTGAIRREDDMAVLDPPPAGAAELDADIVIVSRMRDLRARDSLGDDARLLAIDDHDQRIDLYEVRPLGEARGAADLASVIRSLTQRPRRARLRQQLARWLRNLNTPPTRRAP